MGGQYWNRKGDHEDEDEKIAKPFAEYVGHGNMEFSRKRDDEPDTESPSTCNAVTSNGCNQ